MSDRGTSPGGQDVVFVMLYAGPLLLARAGLASASTGGAETQVSLLARELVRRGHRVTIAAFDVAPGLPAEVDGIAVHRLPRRPAGASRRALWSWRLSLARSVASLDADVFVQRGAGAITGLVGALAFVRRRAFLYSSSSVIDFERPRMGRAARTALRLGVRLATSLVVQSDEQAELCRRHWRRSSTVIRSLAEPAAPRTDVPDAFLWIGRLASYKRPDAFLDLAEALPAARFLLVGTPSAQDPSAEQRVRARAAELPNVELLPPRPREALDPLYRAAVAVVSTSDHEGMPNVLLEGWARGVPALVLSCDPDGIIVRHGLGHNAGGSPERFAALAAGVWEGRADQDALSAQCLAYMGEQHDIGRNAARWEDALRQAEDRAAARGRRRHRRRSAPAVG